MNYRLPDILCALGLSQLKRLDEFKLQRSQVFDLYNKAFQEESAIVLPKERADMSPMWHLYPIQVNAKNRRQIFDELRRVKIGVQVNYLPVHLHPVFNSMNLKGKFPASEMFYEREISLPMSTILTAVEIEYITSRVKVAISKCE